MSSLLQALGTHVDTWGGEARMRRFRAGWPATASEGVKFYRTDAVQYRYRDAGAGQAIVFTADPPMTLEIYDQLVEVFASRFRVIIVELPAMGFSAANGRYRFGFRETNDDLTRFLADVVGDNAIFAFSCVATLAAIDIAMRHPHLCSHLALIQGGDPEAFGRWKAGRDPKGILARPILGQLIMKRMAPSRMPQWYKLSVGRSEHIDRFCRCAERSFAHGALWSLASAYQIYMDERITIAPPRQPMLSLWGGADRSHPADNAHALKRVKADVTCETYADLGHTPELEDPARVFASINAFIST